jgi:hypothetical protein
LYNIEENTNSLMDKILIEDAYIDIINLYSLSLGKKIVGDKELYDAIKLEAPNL